MEVLGQLIVVVAKKVLLVRSPEHRRGGGEEKVREVIGRIAKASYGQVDQDTRDGSAAVWSIPVMIMVRV